MFRWVGLDRVSLREVSLRLEKMGYPTRAGKAQWDATIGGMLRNPVYRGAAILAHSIDASETALASDWASSMIAETCFPVPQRDSPRGVDRDSGPRAD